VLWSARLNGCCLPVAYRATPALIR